MQPGFVIELVKRLFDLESQGAGGLGASVVAIERSSGLSDIDAGFLLFLPICLLAVARPVHGCFSPRSFLALALW
jgi:hypothetical protein